MSGEISWTGEDEKDVGLIRATPVTQGDGIRTTKIDPPTQLLDYDLDNMEEECPEGLENTFLLFPGVINWSLLLDEKPEESASIKCGWKLCNDGEDRRYKQFLKWEGGEDELHGCVEGLHEFLSKNSSEREKKLLVGSVALPGGLVITARPVNRDGECVNDIEVSSPLLQTPSLPPALQQEEGLNSLAFFNFRYGQALKDLRLFFEGKHGDKETSEPWIVPGSLRCGWKFGGGGLVWGGGDDLRGCIHWLHEINERFFVQDNVILVGSVKLPNGVVVKAEAERRPRYEFVRVSGEVELMEVDSEGWMVCCWVVSCRVNCGWFAEQQQVPLRRDYSRKCPTCEQGVLWSKKLTPPPPKRSLDSGDAGGDEAGPVSKRRSTT